MPQVTDSARINAAEYQAKRALAEGRRGNRYEFARIANRMYDTLEACDYPTLTTINLIQRIGRSKAMVLGLRRPLINLALRS